MPVATIPSQAAGRAQSLAFGADVEGLVVTGVAVVVVVAAVVVLGEVTGAFVETEVETGLVVWELTVGGAVEIEPTLAVHCTWGASVPSRQVTLSVLTLHPLAAHCAVRAQLT